MVKIKLSARRPRRLANLLAAAAFVATLVAVAMPEPVKAGSLSNTYVRLNRMSSGTSTGLRVVFRTSGSIATVDGVTVSMPGFTVNATQTVSSDNCASGAGGSGATALSGILSASGSGTTITVTGATAVTPDTRYCFDLTSSSAVTNPAAGTHYVTVATKSSGATVDSIDLTVQVVASDEISVTGVVAPSFNFALDGNADSFTADLSSGAVAVTNGRTVTVNTNAKTGWIAWARDADASLGLRSAAVAHTIPSKAAGTNTTLSAGAEGYLWGVTAITDGAGGGTVAADAAYNALDGSAKGAGFDTTLRPIASSNGTAENDSLVLKARASISAATPAAADYADTITVVGAGNF